MYIALGQGLTSRDEILMSTGTSCHFGHLLKIKEKKSLKSDFIHFFRILSMYIHPGQGQTAPRGHSFDVNRNILSLHSFVASFKKISSKSSVLFDFCFTALQHILLSCK